MLQIVIAVRDGTGKILTLAGETLRETQIRRNGDLREDDQPRDASPEAAPYTARVPLTWLVAAHHLWQSLG